MSYSLVLNSSNVVAGSNNNTYRYNFIQGSFNIPENSEISVSSVVLPYSFFNITKAYSNNILHYFFPISAGSANNFTDFTITIPDGFYTTTDINNFFQNYCIQNGLYLVNSAGQNVYYASISYNPTYYANQIIVFPVPTSLPAGYTLNTIGPSYFYPNSFILYSCWLWYIFRIYSNFLSFYGYFFTTIF